MGAAGVFYRSRALVDELLSTNGVFALNKPPGISSAGLLDYFKRNVGLGTGAMPFSEHFEIERKQREAGKKARRVRIISTLRVGHGGTLDVEAAGLLVVGIGSGCKRMSEFLGGSKVYLADARLGVATDSFDAEGRITNICPADHITESTINDALKQFIGTVQQSPPVYSAIRVDGRRLYDYARSGDRVPVEIKPRTVHIRNISLLYLFNPPTPATGQYVRLPSEVTKYYTSGPYKWDGSQPEMGKQLFPCANDPGAPRLQLLVHSGSGVYVRSLVNDLGQAVGSAATMLTLLRVAQGNLRLDRDCITVEDIPYLDRVRDAIQIANSRYA
ncbi:pseudouridine synthase pus4 [Coemansia sp. Benny D115]|nr:pseudouridine synthase pus4 [Coemansia sp. Benny D115]